LDLIKKEVDPVSTREICLKLNYSWHTVYRYCLELFAVGKIDKLSTKGPHLWMQNGIFSKKIKHEIDDVLDKALDEEIEKQITDLQKQLQELQSKKQETEHKEEQWVMRK